MTNDITLTVESPVLEAPIYPPENAIHEGEQPSSVVPLTEQETKTDEVGVHTLSREDVKDLLKPKLLDDADFEDLSIDVLMLFVLQNSNLTQHEAGKRLAENQTQYEKAMRETVKALSDEFRRADWIAAAVFGIGCQVISPIGSDHWKKMCETTGGAANVFQQMMEQHKQSRSTELSSQQRVLEMTLDGEKNEKQKQQGESQSAGQKIDEFLRALKDAMSSMLRPQ